MSLLDASRPAWRPSARPRTRRVRRRRHLARLPDACVLDQEQSLESVPQPGTLQELVGHGRGAVAEGDQPDPQVAERADPRPSAPGSPATRRDRPAGSGRRRTRASAWPSRSSTATRRCPGCRWRWTGCGATTPPSRPSPLFWATRPRPPSAAPWASPRGLPTVIDRRAPGPGHGLTSPSVQGQLGQHRKDAERGRPERLDRESPTRDAGTMGAEVAEHEEECDGERQRP